MSDEQYKARVNRLEGSLTPNVARYALSGARGYIYAEDDLGHHTMFWSDRCDQYRIGDKVLIEVTRVDE